MVGYFFWGFKNDSQFKKNLDYSNFINRNGELPVSQAGTLTTRQLRHNERRT